MNGWMNESVRKLIILFVNELPNRCTLAALGLSWNFFWVMRRHTVIGDRSEGTSSNTSGEKNRPRATRASIESASKNLISLCRSSKRNETPYLLIHKQTKKIISIIRGPSAPGPKGQWVTKASGPYWPMGPKGHWVPRANGSQAPMGPRGQGAPRANVSLG